MHPEVIRIINTLGAIPLSRGERRAIEEAIEKARPLGKGPGETDRCRRGHPRTPENTYVRTGTKRGKVYRWDACRACNAIVEAQRKCPTCKHGRHDAECWHKTDRQYDCECVAGEME